MADESKQKPTTRRTASKAAPKATPKPAPKTSPRKKTTAAESPPKETPNRGKAATPDAESASAAASSPAGRPVSLQDLLKVEEGSLASRIINLPGNLVGGAYRLMMKTTEGPLQIGKALLLNPEQSHMLEEAGKSLRDLREVAGLTRDELSDVLDLRDKTLLEAVEDGTAVLSFELILRLAAVLARHDPIPFVMQYTRTYKPELWQLLESWGVGALYLNFERERRFLNVYRRHDAVRELSDEGFDKLLDYTRAAFDLGIHFIAEQEQVPDRILSDEELNAELNRADTQEKEPPT